MTPSRGQSVADADRDVRQFLIRVAAALGDVLGDALAGLYVHGSLATGSFRRERSNIDLIAVVRRGLDSEQRAQCSRALGALSDMRPVPGDLKAYVIAEEAARRFEHPVAHEIADRILDVRERGVTLVGPSPETLFAPVPWHAYVNALESEFRRTRSLVETDPATAVLAACRILYGATSLRMEALNKDEAAVWAIGTAPRIYHSSINDALQLYRGTKSPDDVVFTVQEVVAFREYVRERSKAAFERASDTGEDE